MVAALITHWVVRYRWLVLTVGWRERDIQSRGGMKREAQAESTQVVGKQSDGKLQS